MLMNLSYNELERWLYITNDPMYCLFVKLETAHYELFQSHMSSKLRSERNASYQEGYDFGYDQGYDDCLYNMEVA